MTALAPIREGLATNIRTVFTAGQVSAYMLSQPTPPCAWPYPSEIDYDQAMQRGFDELQVKVLALMPLTDDVGSQVMLDELLASSGSNSMKAAIESDKTLAGVVLDLIVESCTGYFTYQLTSGPCLGAEWVVRIAAPG